MAPGVVMTAVELGSTPKGRAALNRPFARSRMGASALPVARSLYSDGYSDTGRPAEGVRGCPQPRRPPRARCDSLTPFVGRPRDSKFPSPPHPRRRRYARRRPACETTWAGTVPCPRLRAAFLFLVDEDEPGGVLVGRQAVVVQPPPCRRLACLAAASLLGQFVEAAADLSIDRAVDRASSASVKRPALMAARAVPMSVASWR